MPVRFRSVAAVLCLIAVAASTLGCGGSGGFESPEACFQSIRVAAHNKDMRGMCNCLTAESQEALAGMLVMYGAMMKLQGNMASLAGPQAAEEANKAKDAVTPVLEKHGVESVDQSEVIAAMASPDRIRALAASIKDKPAFVAEMHAALEPLGQAAKFGEQFEEQIAGELKDVKIDGDQATAVVVTAKGEEPLAFRKTSAGWKFHINLDAMGPAAPPA